ncbi:MAG TPA: hypothetical protein VFE08_00865 [Candidatus Sulfotelmatobacter sp.]|jgi:hypothetical protein|nr:hypothetical protein [Candidatus Sulfotelmatobacter sp.]
MAETTDHSARITKTDGDRYHLVLRDGFRQIDEEIDGPKLMAMLGRETLVNTRGEIVAVGDVLFRMDNEPAGYEIVIGVRERAA